jgi:hypothetical protein
VYIALYDNAANKNKILECIYNKHRSCHVVVIGGCGAPPTWSEYYTNNNNKKVHVHMNYTELLFV